MTLSLANYGTPVVSSRQWTTALSPNAAGTDWNYIANSWTGVNPNPGEWVVLKNLTGTGGATSQHIYNQTTHQNANSNFGYTNQLRAPNGRIFFWCFANNIAYYDPTTESVAFIGPFTESPAINPNASTEPYSASFDTAGLLYGATQESQNRPSCVFVVDPTQSTPTVTVLGYVGTLAAGYTTYGYYIAPDTINFNKWIYVAYGEDPWQLWGLFIGSAWAGSTTYTAGQQVSNGGNVYTCTTGGQSASSGGPSGTGSGISDGSAVWSYVSATASLLYSPNGSAPFIQFSNITNQGWVATIHTDLGHGDDTVTQLWCLDGATYAYTNGQPPPNSLARNVTPASNSLTSPPGLDTTRGIGQVGWRANGSSGTYTYVDYSVVYTAPVTIESLVAVPGGVVGDTASYQGFFSFSSVTGQTTWYGAALANGVAQPLVLYLNGAVYFCGYPDGALYKWTLTAPYESEPSVVNPALIGYYGPSSATGAAGIKYAGNPNPPTTIGASGSLAWSPSAGTSGRLYCNGQRDRNATGAGIGYWDVHGNSFAGTYASPLDTVQSQGLVALETLGYVVMSTNTLSGTGTAPIYVFNHDLAIVSTQTPFLNNANIGQIFGTSTYNVVCGVAGVGRFAYRWDVVAQTLLGQVDLSSYGTIDTVTQGPSGIITIATTTSLLRLDPDTLAVTNLGPLPYTPVSCLADNGAIIYLSVGPTLYGYALPVPDIIPPASNLTSDGFNYKTLYT